MVEHLNMNLDRRGRTKPAASPSASVHPPFHAAVRVSVCLKARKLWGWIFRPNTVFTSQKHDWLCWFSQTSGSHSDWVLDSQQLSRLDDQHVMHTSSIHVQNQLSGFCYLTLELRYLEKKETSGFRWLGWAPAVCFVTGGGVRIKVLRNNLTHWPLILFQSQHGQLITSS